MSALLTRDELRDMRARQGRCATCGRRHDRYPELRDGRPHMCFACLWRWRHGAWPAGIRDAA